MAKRKIALGRGLGALLPEQGDDASPRLSGMPIATRLSDFEDRVRSAGRVVDLDLDLIDPNPFQPRQSFDEVALEELAESIRQLGIIQPITVRAAGKGRYEVISGERRTRASRRAGLKAVPAYLREADVEEMLEMALVENVQREELNPMEIALGYHRLVDECGLTQEAVADKVGKNRVTVANFLRLLKLPPPIQACLRDSTISVGHARALIPVDDERAQLKLLAQTVDKGLSVRAVEQAVRSWHKARERAAAEPKEVLPTPPAGSGRDALVLRALTDRLRGTLGTKVQIRPNTGSDGGRIEVAYFSDDDLERLIELIAS